MALLPKVDSSKYQAERDRIKKFSRLDKKELNQENSENNKQNEEDDTVDEVVDHQSQPRFTDNNLVVQHDGTPVRFVLNFEIIANRIVAAIEEIVAPLDSLASMTGDENDSSPNNKTMVINSDSSLITFGIYGPWGAGKSTLMYALDQELQDSKYFKIKLNPWKWDGKGSIHSYVRRAVLRSASETLFRSRLNSFTKNLRLLNLSIWFGKRWLWVVFSALVAITVIFVWPDSASQVTPNANSSTPPKIEQSKWRAVFTGGTAFLLLILNSIGKPFKKWIEDTVSERMLLGDTSNIGAEALQKTYRELAQAAKTNKKRFVFFIDDLDRCMPDRVTDFVESIHSLTNAGCIVFVACDEEYLSAAINAKHESIVRHHPDKEEFGKQFIEKIVQIPFRIPSINENDIYELGLATKLNTLEESIDDSETFDGQDRTVEFKSIGDEQIESDENVRVDKVLLTQIFGELLDGHVKLLKLNLRQIKSLSNTITLLLSIFADDFRTESDAKRMAAFILADKLDPFWLDGHYFKNPISIGRIGGHQSVVRHLEAILGDETDILEDLYWRIGRQPTPPKTTAEKAALNI